MMFGVVFHRVVLGFRAVSKLQHDFHEIFIHVETAIVTKGQRPVYSWVRNGAPHIDDLESSLKESFHLITGKIPAESGDGRFNGLIDMDEWYRLTVQRTIVDHAGTPAADNWQDIVHE